jgi:hypothetical protein
MRLTTISPINYEILSGPKGNSVALYCQIKSSQIKSQTGTCALEFSNDCSAKYCAADHNSAIAMGSAYYLASLMQPRMYGSSDKYTVRSNIYLSLMSIFQH